MKLLCYQEKTITYSLYTKFGQIMFPLITLLSSWSLKYILCVHVLAVCPCKICGKE
uniref:Uncharacterized protein n=1 Tax=Anguilla anguilla TaxID=7936 RepID=A0A0E9RFV1_ANGAN